MSLVFVRQGVAHAVRFIEIRRDGREGPSRSIMSPATWRVWTDRRGIPWVGLACETSLTRTKPTRIIEGVIDCMTCLVLGAKGSP